MGGDPARKLSAEDRLIGSSSLAQKTGVVPAYIAVGAAAGLRRLVEENNLEQSMANGKNMLLQTSGLAADSTLTDLILKYYQMIIDGCSVAELCATAEQIKATNRTNVI